MRKMKYIILNQAFMKFMTPIVFPDHVQHNEMAIAMNAIGEISGAGFCYIDDNKYVCYGKSVSLKVESGEKDSYILNKYFGLIDPDL